MSYLIDQPFPIVSNTCPFLKQPTNHVIHFCLATASTAGWGKPAFYKFNPNWIYK